MMPFGSAGVDQETRMLVAVRFSYITFRGAEGTNEAWGKIGKEGGERREEGGGRREEGGGRREEGEGRGGL